MQKLSHWRIIVRVLLGTIGAGVIILGCRHVIMARKLSALKDQPKTLIYEMYPSSWEGGFPAMTEHLSRLEQLQVDYVWLAPCYPSGGIDGGYDVTDYEAIDPRYGTLEDFDVFVQTANAKGIDVIMDLVLNHTSDQHPWFLKSLLSQAPYRDYYLWSDADLGWGTMFDGSSAFEWSPNRQQYYCHIYHKNQPDLNWNNPAVVAEFQQIIDFWTLEHGLKGFRVDSAQLIGKDFSATLLPRNNLGTAAGLLKYYQKSETPQILHQLFDGRDLFTFGEMTALNTDMFNQMVAPDGPLTAGLNLTASNAFDKRFGFIDASPDLNRLKKSLHHWSKHPSFVAMLESHDVPRFTSRAGIDGKEALQILFGVNPRIVCLYQGQEIGTINTELSNNIDDYRDIQTIMRYETAIKNGQNPQDAMEIAKTTSRDNARQPIDLQEYSRQEQQTDSCLKYAINLIQEWKEQ